jgi:branched-chain amino acid transport system substrate-binding protein
MKRQPVRQNAASVFRSIRSLLPVLLAAVALASLPVLSACAGDDDSDRDGETIVLGSIFSTTGDSAAFGPQQLKAAELAIEQINEDGGVDGADLILDQRDDRGDPATSARLMRKLIEEEDVLAVLGPTFSNSSAEAHPVANELKTPVLAVSNTGPGIVGDCPYACEYIFRDSLGEAEAIPANIREYVATSDPQRVDILYPEGDAFGRSTAAIARKTFKSEGVPIRQGVRLGKDGRVVRTGFGEDSAIMITASSGETVVELIRQVRDVARFKGGILGGNALNSATAAEALGKTGKGAQSAAAWYAGNDSEENREFVEEYRAAYGEEPDQFAAQAYTGIELIAEAAEDADLSFDDLAADRELMVTALEQVREETPLGDFAFTPDHDVIQPIWIVKMDGRGGYDLVKEVPAPTR